MLVKGLIKTKVTSLNQQCLNKYLRLYQIVKLKGNDMTKGVKL